METPVWERCKENAAPLERGRNVKTLEKSFAGDLEKTRVKNEHLIERYESLVRPTETASFELTDDADDPLIHWLSYIKFYQDAFPSNTHGQFLLFERCMRSLYHVQKYTNDSRFVRICCRYAGQTESPKEVFQHLYQQKIGTELTMFWIAFSFVCEKQGDYQFAKKVLEKGISKKAKPLNKLEERYRQFQKRMASHWLNATQNGGEEDDVDDQANAPSRGVLGSLTEESVRRNDRRSRPQQSFLSRPSTNQETLADRTNNLGNNQNPGQHFAIFEDNENRPTDQSLLLDESAIYPIDRPIEREQDRKKENHMERQTWNERGGYAPAYETKPPRARSKAPLPPFAIHIDEECAAEHAQQESESLRAQNEMRRHRDERTFKERDRAGIVDKLQRDPLMYVREPGRFEADRVAEEEEQAANPVKKEREDKGNQSRHQSKSTKETSKSRRRPGGHNHKLLKSAMGEEQNFEEARARSNYFTLLDPLKNFSNLALSSNVSQETVESQMSMDESDVSMDENSVEKRPSQLDTIETSTIPPSGPTPRNSSTASSTIDEAVAVGAPEGRVEQTINTQLALRELSIMFSSPAMDRDVSKISFNRSGSLGPAMNASGVSLPAIEEKSDDHEASEAPTFAELAEEAPSDSSFARMEENPRSIFQNKEVPEPSFSIFNDEAIKSESEAPRGEKERESTSARAAFSIYNDGDDGGAVENDSDVSKSVGNTSDEVQEIQGDGDTATFSVYGDAIRELIGDDGDSGGETASFGGIADCLSPSRSELKRSRSKSELSDDDIPPAFDTDDDTDDETGTYGNALDFARATAISYPDQHRQDVAQASERLLRHSEAFPKNRRSLYSILSQKGKVFHLAEHVLPKCLRLGRKSRKIRHEEIKISKSSLTLDRELGRGAYGVVALLENHSPMNNNNVAMKAQSPTECLAWEFEVLKKIQDRLKGIRGDTGPTFPFPTPLSYLHLEDGAMFTMSAASRSGLTLFDLVNIYRSPQNFESNVMPEILAIHYTARMLNHVELLHHRGKILHCDIKPDNWVLAASDIIGGEQIEAADIQLVDFGRSVDLGTVSGQRGALNQAFVGKATRDNMRCVAMRMKPPIPWSFDIDTYGICESAHVMLFGETMQLDENKWMPKRRLHRYHVTDIWIQVFQTLLKLEEGSKMALGSRPLSVRQLRETLDEYLSSRKENLRSAMKHQATMLWSKRPEQN